jgi:hypothetical protein
LVSAKEAVSIGLERLRAADVPIERPQDYFAEMVKSDSHMEFIRSKLAKQKERLERIETKKKVWEERKVCRSLFFFFFFFFKKKTLTGCRVEKVWEREAKAAKARKVARKEGRN